jgi:hypothetical protein
MININPDDVKRISESEEFNKLLSDLNQNNPRFREIPADHQKLAVILLMSGNIDSIEGLERLYTKRPIPTIEEFLTPEYLGEAGSFFFDPSNLRRKELLEIFSPESIIRQYVITGAIGTAKTTGATVAQLFNLFRINCLRRPQLSMGSNDPTKTINLQLFTVTKEKARSILYDRVKSFLGFCQYYTEVPREENFLDFRDEKYEHIIPWTEVNDGEDSYLAFPNNIRVRSGSQARHALGEDVFGGILDESEFRTGLTHGKVEDTFQLYYEILERIRSRFLGSRFTLMCLVSSIRGARGMMSQHIEESQHRADTKISQYSIWDVKYPNAIREHGYFYVMRGTTRHPSRVMTDAEKGRIDRGVLEAPAACEFVKVPRIYLDDFERRTEASLMNLAGLASLGHDTPFDDLSEVEDPSLMPVIEISAPLQGGSPLRNQLPSEYFVRTPEGWRLRRYPGAPRYSHCDLGDVGQAGITVLHKELSVTGKIIYVADLVLKITSPNRISLDSVRDFMFDLKDYYGINFAVVTADQYQSTQLLQRLQATNFASVNVGRLSVDTNRIPYDTLSALVAEGTLRTGQMRDLRKQLESVYFDDRGKPRALNFGRKDIADSLCGAAVNAVNNPADVPSNSFEHYGLIQSRISELTAEYEELA